MTGLFVRVRWLENPCYQYEHSFRHRLPFDRSSPTHWRQRLGEEQLAALIQESLAVAHKTGAIETKDLSGWRWIPSCSKAITHPTDAGLMHRALVKLAKRHGIGMHRSYVRVAKRAAIMVGCYSHAHQFKRARRMLKFLRTRLGRVIGDINRKIDGNAALDERFRPLLILADLVRARRTTAAIKRQMKRRAAIEPVIGHLKAEHRMERNHLKGREGDRINAILAAAYNFR